MFCIMQILLGPYHEEVRARGGRPPRILNLYHVEVTDWLQASAAFTSIESVD